jgi:hypothetical protein
MQGVETGPGQGGVTVAVPSGGMTRFITFEMSVEGVFVPKDSSYARNSGSSPAWNRNEAIRRAMLNPLVTHLFFVDDDHMFNQELIMNLLAHKLEIVCALTLLSKPYFWPVLFSDEVKIEGKTKWQSIPWTELDHHKGLYGPVWACAGAGILVAKTLLQRIPEPWFALGQYNKEDCHEDMYFYDQVRKAGVPLYVDLDNVMGHTAPCTALPVKGEDGLWYVHLIWENGETVKLSRKDSAMRTQILNGAK